MSNVDMYDLKCEHGIYSQEELFARLEKDAETIARQKAEIEELRHLLCETGQGDAILARRELALREALNFYADPASYRAMGHAQIDADTVPIKSDAGAKARSALSTTIA